MTGRIELHIVELVLDGFPPGDRDAIAAALRGRLASLLAEHGLPGSPLDAGTVDRTVGRTVGRTVDRVDAGRFDHPAGAPPRVTGERIAAAVYQGLSS